MRTIKDKQILCLIKSMSFVLIVYHETELVTCTLKSHRVPDMKLECMAYLYESSSWSMENLKIQAENYLRDIFKQSAYQHLIRFDTISLGVQMSL